MAQYLDKTGLIRMWSKIKAKLATKQNTIAFGETAGRVSSIDGKTIKAEMAETDKGGNEISAHYATKSELAAKGLKVSEDETETDKFVLSLDDFDTGGSQGLADTYALKTELPVIGTIEL